MHGSFGTLTVRTMLAVSLVKMYLERAASFYARFGWHLNCEDHAGFCPWLPAWYTKNCFFMNSSINNSNNNIIVNPLVLANRCSCFFIGRLGSLWLLVHKHISIYCTFYAPTFMHKRPFVLLTPWHCHDAEMNLHSRQAK
eukprot:jgi/Botrbrau1/15798/Bobra.4_1s0149.1